MRCCTGDTQARTAPRSHSWLVLVGFILISSVVGAARVDAASVTLSWTAPTTNADGTRLTDLASYRVYLATSTPPCPSASFFTVPSPTTAPASGQTMSSLRHGAHRGHDVLRARDRGRYFGNESACSGAASGVAHPDFSVTPSRHELWQRPDREHGRPDLHSAEHEHRDPLGCGERRRTLQHPVWRLLFARPRR